MPIDTYQDLNGVMEYVFRVCLNNLKCVYIHAINNRCSWWSEYATL